MYTYENFPPFPYFISVLKSCPRAVWIYIQLWRSRDEQSRLNFNLRDTRRLFLMSPTLVRNNLMALVELGLVSIHEKPEKEFEIELVDFDEEEFDSTEIS
jgi:hypothetical protein